MTRVMIAVDGSELDERVAGVAHSLFGADADYLAVNAQRQPVVAALQQPFLPSVYGTANAYVPPTRQDAVAEGSDAESRVSRLDAATERADTTAQAALDNAGIEDASVIGEIGDPAQVVLDAAERHAVDVLVVGTHDRGWLSGLIDRPVSKDLIDSAPVPVLLVRSD